MASWTDALKEYAKVKGQFVVPKKDSDDYKAVKELQAKMKPKTAESAPVAEVHPVTKAKIERRKKQSLPEGTVPPPATEEAPKKAPAKKHAIQAEVPRPAKPAPIAPAVVAEEAPKRRPRKQVPTEPAVVPASEGAVKRVRKQRAPKVEIEQKPTVLTF